jgi:hypothetical protein
MTETDDNSSAGGQGAFGLWADLRAWRQRATPDGCPIYPQRRAARRVARRHPHRLRPRLSRRRCLAAPTINDHTQEVAA